MPTYDTFATIYLSCVTDSVMGDIVNEREAIIAMISLWRNRTRKQFKQVLDEINVKLPEGSITEDIFNAKYRRKHVKRVSIYDPDEVFAIIVAFYTGIPREQACTPLEAILLSDWTKTGLQVIRLCTRVFPPDHLDATLNWYLFEKPHNFDYFDLNQQHSAYEAISARVIRRSAHQQRPPPKPIKLIDTGEFLNIRRIAMSIERASKSSRLLDVARTQIWKGKFKEAALLLEPFVNEVRVEEKTLSSAHVEANNLMAVMQMHQGNYEAAFSVLRRSERIAAQVDRHLLAQIKANAGAVAFYSGQLTEAIQYFHQSYAIAQEYDNHTVMAFAKTGIGNVAAETLQFTLAETAYQEALQLAMFSQSHERAAFLNMNLGVLRFSQGLINESQEYYDATLLYLREVEHPVLDSQLRWNYGSLLLVTADARDTYPHNYLQQAMEIAQDVRLPWLEIAVTIDSGIRFLQHNYVERAREIFWNMLWASTQIKYKDFAAKALYGWTLCELRREFLTGFEQPSAVAEAFVHQIPVDVRNTLCPLLSPAGIIFDKAEIRFRRVLGAKLNKFPIASVLKEIFA